MKLLGVEAARSVAALLVVMLHAAYILGGPQDYGQQAFGGPMTCRPMERPLLAAGHKAMPAKPPLIQAEPRPG